MSETVRAFDNDEAVRGEYRVPAAEKVLDILEFMATQPDGLTQTGISNGLGRSIHEVYRILQLLERRGYLVRNRSDRFCLSLKLFELAHQHPPVNRLIECALPMMRELSANIDQSCHLVVLKGTRALVVLQVDSPLPMRYSVALGSQFPVLETSSGAVLLAGLERQDRDSLVDLILASREDSTPRAEIDARIDEAASLGYEMRPSLVVGGCTNISMRVREHTGATVAALTVPFLPQRAARLDREAVFLRTAAAAEQISAALGAVDALPASDLAARGAGKPTRRSQNR